MSKQAIFLWWLLKHVNCRWQPIFSLLILSGKSERVTSIPCVWKIFKYSTLFLPTNVLKSDQTHNRRLLHNVFNDEIDIVFCFGNNHFAWYEFSKLLMKINEDTGKIFIKISIALLFLIVYLWQIGAKFVVQIVTALRNQN